MNYFKEDEFKCKCGCGGDVSSRLKTLTNRARYLSGIPYVVTSGYRCEEHNKKVGGSATSSHIKGEAVDLYAEDSGKRWKIVRGLMDAGFTRIGVSKNFIHADIDKDKPSEVMWEY
jgi:zinc D-Ala-D-Ala carboxypeptidase